MTAPLYLLDGVPLVAEVGDALRLDGAEGRHAITVRRTRVGESIDVADGAGTLARCRVESVGSGALELRVEQVEVLAESVPRLVLVQALAKSGRDELAVETATELGVDEVVPWQAARSIVTWSGERGRRSHGKWESCVRAAAKQSRRARLPVVSAAVTSRELAARTAAVTASGGVVLVLHESADEPMARFVVSESCAEVLVVVGPEGGIDADELAALTAVGGRAVRLGPQVLRTSSAGPAALVLLSRATGRWT